MRHEPVHLIDFLLAALQALGNIDRYSAAAAKEVLKATAWLARAAGADEIRPHRNRLGKDLSFFCLAFRSRGFLLQSTQSSVFLCPDIFFPAAMYDRSLFTREASSPPLVSKR